MFGILSIAIMKAGSHSKLVSYLCFRFFRLCWPSTHVTYVLQVGKPKALVLNEFATRLENRQHQQAKNVESLFVK